MQRTKNSQPAAFCPLLPTPRQRPLTRYHRRLRQGQAFYGWCQQEWTSAGHATFGFSLTLHTKTHTTQIISPNVNPNTEVSTRENLCGVGLGQRILRPKSPTQTRTSWHEEFQTQQSLLLRGHGKGVEGKPHAGKKSV